MLQKTTDAASNPCMAFVQSDLRDVSGWYDIGSISGRRSDDCHSVRHFVLLFMIAEICKLIEDCIFALPHREIEDRIDLIQSRCQLIQSFKLLLSGHWTFSLSGSDVLSR